MGTDASIAKRPAVSAGLGWCVWFVIHASENLEGP